MDLFDRRILAVLKDGEFKEFLREVRFSHNTLRLHLSRLERQGFVVKAKKTKKIVEGPVSLTPCLRSPDVGSI